jgi:hypothetical protein
MYILCAERATGSQSIPLSHFCRGKGHLTLHPPQLNEITHLHAVIVGPAQGEVPLAAHLRELVDVFVLRQRLGDGVHHRVGVAVADDLDRAGPDAHAVQDLARHVAAHDLSGSGGGGDVHIAAVVLAEAVVRKAEVVVQVNVN